MLKQASWEDHQQSKRSERRQVFFQRLQELVGRIHAAGDIDEIMLDVSRDICILFGCDRMTLYTVGASRMTIESKIKTGMDSFKNFVLPIANSSVAGHVALTKRSFNIRNVYDEEELRAHSRELRFLDAVDRRTGYRTREMVVAPIVNAASGELLGVLQLINNRLGGPFPELVEEGALNLCKTLAVVFEQRSQPQVQVHTRFDPLVVLGMLSRPELELAKRTARRKQMDLEDVLIDEFQVRPDQLGAAYAEFFNVPYEPFREGRAGTRMQDSLKRDYVEANGWLLLDVSPQALTVLALDPDRLRGSRSVEALFPGHEVRLRVTTRREFLQTLVQLYGPARQPEQLAEEAVLRRIQQIVAGALASAAPELQAVVRPEHVRLLRSESADDGRGKRQGQLALRIDLKLP